jgi:hypothetical protein
MYDALQGIFILRWRLLSMRDKYTLTPKENIFLAKKILVVSIYNSAHLEGINVTFPDTQTIVDGVTVSNMKTDDLQVILNLKNAWKYTFDRIEAPLNAKRIER